MTEARVVEEMKRNLVGVPFLNLMRNNVSAHVETDWKYGGGRYFRSGLGVGTSDFIGYYGPFFVAIEVKSHPHGKLTDAQRLFLEAVNAAGGIGFVVHSGNVHDVKRMLDTRRKEIVDGLHIHAVGA